jgi:hypothetical protein
MIPPNSGGQKDPQRRAEGKNARGQKKMFSSLFDPVHIGKHKYIKNIKKHKKPSSASYVFVCLSTKSVQAKNLPGHFQKHKNRDT